MLAYEYGLSILPARSPQLEVFDALQLAATCGVTRPDSSSEPAAASTGAVLTHTATAERTFHVDVAGDDAASGGWQSPFRTIHRALAAVRSQRAASSGIGAGRGSQQQKNGSEPAAIVLHAGCRHGEHFLNATIELNAKDSGLTIMLRVLARRAT